VSPEQIELVRETVHRLPGQEEALAAALIDALTVQAPSALRFLPSPSRAAPALMRELRTFAQLLPDFPALTHWARHLGEGAGTAATAAELIAIGSALVGALVVVLGDHFDADETNAWWAAVTLLTELAR